MPRNPNPRRLLPQLHSVLRCERFGLRELAARTNRTLRTLSARRTAAAVYETVHATLRITTTRTDLTTVMLRVMMSRPGWTQTGARQFVYTFGHRSASMIVPRGFDARQLMALIARVEVKVLLGDSDPDVLMNFQTLAARELQQLSAMDRL